MPDQANFSKIGTPILEIKMDSIGQVGINAPGVPTETICKVLLGIVVDLIFTSFPKKTIVGPGGS